MINALTNKTRRISIIECKESWHATRLIIFVKVEFPSLRVFPLIYIYLFWKKISPLRRQNFNEFTTGSFRMVQLVREATREPLTRDFSRLRSLLRRRVDGPPMNAIRSRRSSKNVAHSHANDTRPRRINERHRCRASSRRSLIGRRGITRRNRAVQCTGCPPISKKIR